MERIPHSVSEQGLLENQEVPGGQDTTTGEDPLGPELGFKEY